MAEKAPAVYNRNMLPPFEMSDNDHAWPEAAHLSVLFPPFMCRAIHKDHQKKTAAIKLSFPGNPNMCHLILDVEAGVVPRIARELFDIHVQDANNQRSIATGCDRAIRVGTTVTISGADLSSVERLFGAVVSRAVRAHDTQKQERSMGIVYTNCCSMQIWAQADLPARMTLMLHAETLYEIQVYLFPFLHRGAEFTSAS